MAIDPIADLKLPKLSQEKKDKLCLTFHWAASTYNVDGLLSHYHFVIDKDGGVHNGVDVIKNCPVVAGYAAHVKGANTCNIGLSCAAMATASESEANHGRYGSYPMTKAQIEKMCEVASVICKFYGIPVVKERVLGHKEWDTIHGKPEDRWDVNCIPHLDIRPKKLPDGSYESMNWIRDRIKSILKGESVSKPDNVEEIRAAFKTLYTIPNLSQEFIAELNRFRQTSVVKALLD